MYEQDPVTGYSVFVLDNQDIDVSCDGRIWFHFGGSNCLTKARKMPLKALPGGRT